MMRITTKLDLYVSLSINGRSGGKKKVYGRISRFGKRGVGIPLRFGKRFDDGDEIAEMAQAWRHFKQANGADVANGDNRKPENGVKSDVKSVGKAGLVDDVQNVADDDVEGDSSTDEGDMASQAVDKRAPRRPMRFGKRSKTLRYSWPISCRLVFMQSKTCVSLQKYIPQCTTIRSRSQRCVLMLRRAMVELG